MYRVLTSFTDLQDCNHIYDKGDIYPRDGYAPTGERVAELLGSENRLKIPLIKEIHTSSKPAKAATTKGRERA